jgi:hypothetical protein
LEDIIWSRKNRVSYRALSAKRKPETAGGMTTTIYAFVAGANRIIQEQTISLRRYATSLFEN